MKFEVGKTYHHTRALAEAIDYKCIHVDEGKAVLFWKSQVFPTGQSSVVDLYSEYHKEVKPKVKVDCWVTVYKTGNIGGGYPTKEDALFSRASNCVGIVKLKLEVAEGEGL